MRTRALIGCLLGVCILALAHDTIPIETVTVKDIDVEGSPIKVWGTCDAYADEREPGFMFVGIEENNLFWQNISDKTIKYALIDVVKTDVRGKLYEGYHQLMRERAPEYSNRMLEPQRYPSGRVHVFSQTVKMTVKEYQLKPHVTPTCEVRNVYTEFTDGSKWIDKQHYDDFAQGVQMHRGQ
jgi:hypothetical protein